MKRPKWMPRTAFQKVETARWKFFAWIWTNHPKTYDLVHRIAPFDTLPF